MISKRTRRSTKAVEPLTQFPITAEKGIDISKPADNLNTVQELENFDITTSGDLELRKPMLVKQTFSSTDTEKVLKVFPLYDPNYRLVVYVNPTNNRTWVRIVDTKNNVQPLRYSWANYLTEEEYTQALTEQTLLAAEKAPFDWSGIQLSSLSTASVCTNVRVDVCSSVFKINNAVVMHDASLLPENTNVYREIQISYSPYIPAWVVKIITPVMNILTQTGSSDDLPFDANQALDNPYALRDIYNSVAPTVKGALAYISSITSEGGRPEPYTGNAIVHSTTRSFITTNPAYSEVPNTVRITGAYVDTLNKTSPGTFYGTLRCNVDSDITNRTLANRQVSLHLGDFTYLETPRILFEVPVASVVYRPIAGFGFPNYFSECYIWDKTYCFQLDDSFVDNAHVANAQLYFDDSGRLSVVGLPIRVTRTASASDNANITLGTSRNTVGILSYLEYDAVKGLSGISTEASLPESDLYPEPQIVQHFANRILAYTGDWAGYRQYHTTNNGVLTTTLQGRIARCLKLEDIGGQSGLETLNQETELNFETGYFSNNIVYRQPRTGVYVFYMLADPDTRHMYKKFPQALDFNVRSGTGASTQICTTTSGYVAEFAHIDYYVPIEKLETDNEYWRVL